MNIRGFVLALTVIGAALGAGRDTGAAAQDAVIQPDPGQDVTPFLVSAAQEPALSRAAEIKLLRQRVKYVFVLFQENRSYDSYFASFPGGRGLFAQPSAR